MFKNGAILGLYCETPVHAGSGNDLGVIDLPIQREKPTDYPVIYSSSLKGAIKSSFEKNKAWHKKLDEISMNLKDEPNNVGIKEVMNCIQYIFGDEKGEIASAISFTDARILLFPVKSAKNVFAWITCPMVLERLKRDGNVAGFNMEFEVPQVCGHKALIPNKSSISENNKIVLEEYTYDVETNNELDKIIEWIIENIMEGVEDFWKKKLKSDVIILPDDEFKDFVKHSTELIARIKIDNSKKVTADGSLRYEENLPSETVMYGVVMASDILCDSENLSIKTSADVIKFLKDGLNDRIQIGGNETIGRGIVKTNLKINNSSEGDNNDK